MKILAIDFGLKKIGLAVSEGILAEPLGIVKKKEQIKKICERYKIEKIVIGLSEGKMAQKTKQFGQKLSRETGLPVVYQDETLTSREAQNLMIKIGKSKKGRKKGDHAIAAALILNEYLNLTR